jgi:transposase
LCAEKLDRLSRYWRQYQTKELYSREVIKVKFESNDCRDCVNREKCVRNKTGAGRQLLLPTRELYQALKQTRSLLSSKEGGYQYRQRAGIEGTISQAVRRGSLRRSRYRGLQKTHLQETAVAAGINVLRTVNFLNHQPTAKTRISQFARLMN